MATITIDQLKDPYVLGFIALAMGGIFLPQLKTLPSTLSSLLSSTKKKVLTGSAVHPDDLANQLAMFFATKGDEQGTMLASALKDYVDSFQKVDYMALCKKRQEENKRKPSPIEFTLADLKGKENSND